MLNETITLKYSRVENGAPVGVRRKITVAQVLAELERMCSLPNDYALMSIDEPIMSFRLTASEIVANGEAKMGGGLYYSCKMGTARAFEDFVQHLYITQLLDSPDGSGLKSHFPISPEVWLK